jgi:hypothetical protein
MDNRIGSKTNGGLNMLSATSCGYACNRSASVAISLTPMHCRAQRTMKMSHKVEPYFHLKCSATQKSIRFRLVMPAGPKPASRLFYGFRLENCRNDDTNVGHSIVLACT